MAAKHLQVFARNGVKNMSGLSDPRAFGKEAFIQIQAHALSYLQGGFRVLMRVGENGGQSVGTPLTFDILGGEVLKTTIKSLYDPSKEVLPSDVDKKSDADCVFDKIIKGQIPVKPIVNDGEVFVFTPSEKLAKEHILFIPLEHIRDISKVANPNFFGSLFLRIAEFAAKSEFRDGFILESNNGPYAGQMVQHLHVHMRGGEKLESPFWQDWA